MRVIRTLVAVTALVASSLAFVASTATPAAAVELVRLRVTDEANHDWWVNLPFFEPGGFELVPGPGQPLNVGSMWFESGQVDEWTGSDEGMLAQDSLAGVRLADVEFLSYDAYVDTGADGAAPYLSFEVDRVPGGTEPLDRLFFWPDVNGSVMQDEWQWWGIARGSSVFDVMRSSGGLITHLDRTLDQYVAENPDAQFDPDGRGLEINFHGEQPGMPFRAAVDRVSVRVGETLTQWDFEPLATFVDDSLTSPGIPACGDGSVPKLPSVQAGIDAAPTGKYVYVCAGDYPETPTLAKSLDLLGSQRGNPSFGTRPTDEEAVVQGVIADGADDVVIDGFRLEGRPGPGIEVSGGGAVAIRNNSIALNSGGILLNGATATIVDNLISTNPLSGVMSNVGIASIGQLTGSTIERNEISGMSGPAITIGGPSTGLAIRGNALSHSRGINIVNATGATIVDNDIEAIAGAGILVAGGNSDLTITGNFVFDASAAGIRVSHANTNVRVVGNDLRWNNAGVKVPRQGGVVALRDNRFFQNIATGIHFMGTTALNAENNWWGCNAGPGNAACQKIVSPGPVDSSPWLVLRVGRGATVGTAPRSTAITASFATSGAAPGAPNAAVRDGINVAFATTVGTMQPASALTLGGSATSLLQRTSSQGAATVSAGVDNQSVGIDVPAS